MNNFTEGLRSLQESNRLVKEHALDIGFRSRPNPVGGAAKFLLDEMTLVWDMPPDTIVQNLDTAAPGETFCLFAVTKDAVDRAEDMRGGGLLGHGVGGYIKYNANDVDDDAARIIPKRAKVIAASSILPDSQHRLGVPECHLALIRRRDGTPEGTPDLVGHLALDIATDGGDLRELLQLSLTGLPTAVWPTGAVLIRPDGRPIAVGSGAQTVCGWLEMTGRVSPVTALTSTEYTVVAGHQDGSTSQLRLALPPRIHHSRPSRAPQRSAERPYEMGRLRVYSRIGDIIDLGFPPARPEGRPADPVTTVVVSGNIIATLHAGGAAHLSVRPDLPAWTPAPPDGWSEAFTDATGVHTIPGRHIVVEAAGGTTIFRCTPVPNGDPVPPSLHIGAPGRFHLQPYSVDHGRIIGRHHLVTSTDGIHPVWLPSAEDIESGNVGALDPSAATLLPDGPSLRMGGGAWDEVTKTSGDGWAEFSTRTPLTAGDEPFRLLRSLGIRPDDPTTIANLLPRRARDAKHIRLLARLGV